MLSRLLGGVALSALAFGLATQAYAQSTGTQEVEKEKEVEKVVVTGERQGKGGVIIKEKRPKTRSTVTQDYLGTQPSGQTAFQSLNMVPGYNFTNNDPYGSSGGNMRIRGFDGARVSVTVDGIPLNDTGNYAIFTNQMVDPEYLSRVGVNQGTTDVDSPTASATGGTVNLVTRKPSEDLTLSLGGSVGSWNYQRGIFVIDTGEYRGASAFAGYSFQEYDKFRGPGELQKTQTNARLYQKIGDQSFISVIGHYNENRNNSYRSFNYSELAQFGYGGDNFATCTRDAPNNGVVDNDNAGANTNDIANPSSCTNFYNLRINPSNTGNIRLQSNFQLTDSVRLTVDPSWQYVKANGGGTFTVSETDSRLIAGVDLNGDGDTLDTVRLYNPSNTNTSRYGVTASLIWDLDENNTFRVAYTGDHGRHRQTGAYGDLYANGNPVDIFGGLDDINARVYASDGQNFLRARDRLSHAILNQVSASYTGHFFEDTVLVDVGVRAPYFSRDLNQYCYTRTNTSTVLCTTEAFTDADGDHVGTLAAQGANTYIAPFSTSFEYDALLPNVGVSWEFLENNYFYGSYAEGLSAPRTDNLYTAKCDTCADAGANAETAAADAVTFPGVAPERTQAFDLGYRYQGRELTLAAALWYNQFQDRIVSSFDVDCGCNIDRNVGDVLLKGLDAELGWQATQNLLLYVSASYINSELQDNIPTGVGAFLATKGKELVETPDYTISGRIQYRFNEYVRMGVQGKFVDDRWATDINDLKTPAFTLFDADLLFDMAPLGLGETFVQVNATNLLDENWLGSISSTSTASASTRYQIGAPRTVQLQVKTKF